MPSWSLLGEVEHRFARVTATAVARDARSLSVSPTSRNPVHRGLVGMARARAMPFGFGRNRHRQESSQLCNALTPRGAMRVHQAGRCGLQKRLPGLAPVGAALQQESCARRSGAAVPVRHMKSAGRQKPLPSHVAGDVCPAMRTVRSGSCGHARFRLRAAVQVWIPIAGFDHQRPSAEQEPKPPSTTQTGHRLERRSESTEKPMVLLRPCLLVWAADVDIRVSRLRSIHRHAPPALGGLPP